VGFEGGVDSSAGSGVGVGVGDGAEVGAGGGGGTVGKHPPRMMMAMRSNGMNATDDFLQS